jgi:hypothetical protein
MGVDHCPVKVASYDGTALEPCNEEIRPQSVKERQHITVTIGDETDKICTLVACGDGSKVNLLVTIIVTADYQ